MEKIVICICIWNAISFFAMGIDKYKAIHNKRRISEKTLITLALLMGSVGSIVGALVFHHKIKKLKFQIMLPVALVINVFMAIGLAYIGGYIVIN